MPLFSNSSIYQESFNIEDMWVLEYSDKNPTNKTKIDLRYSYAYVFTAWKNWQNEWTATMTKYPAIHNFSYVNTTYYCFLHNRESDNIFRNLIYFKSEQQAYEFLDNAKVKASYMGNPKPVKASEFFKKLSNFDFEIPRSNSFVKVPSFMQSSYIYEGEIPIEENKQSFIKGCTVYITKELYNTFSNVEKEKINKTLSSLYNF